MNTGEAPDTFAFELVGVPFDWTAAAATATLNPRGAATASVDLTAAHDAPVGGPTVTATAASTTAPGVASSAPLDLEVLHRADLSVLEVAAPDAPAELLVGESATFTVTTQVTNDGPSWPTDATLTLATTAAPGVSVTPAAASAPVAGLEAGEVRVLTQAFTVTCDGPGDQTHAVTADLQAGDVEACIEGQAAPGDTFFGGDAIATPPVGP